MEKFRDKAHPPIDDFPQTWILINSISDHGTNGTLDGGVYYFSSHCLYYRMLNEREMAYK